MKNPLKDKAPLYIIKLFANSLISYSVNLLNSVYLNPSLYSKLENPR